REVFPSGADCQPRHGREIEEGGNGRRKALVTLAHTQPPSLLDRGHQLLIVGLDVGGWTTGGRGLRGQGSGGDGGQPNPNGGHTQARGKSEIPHHSPIQTGLRVCLATLSAHARGPSQGSELTAFSPRLRPRHGGEGTGRWR